jgi:hypothetical protein
MRIVREGLLQAAKAMGAAVEEAKRLGVPLHQIVEKRKKAGI